MGEDYLGSVVAEDGATWSEQNPEQLNDMIDTAVDLARTEAVRMLDRLKNDFLV
jgi:hypothetical protein